MKVLKEYVSTMNFKIKYPILYIYKKISIMNKNVAFFKIETTGENIVSDKIYHILISKYKWSDISNDINNNINSLPIKELELFFNPEITLSIQELVKTHISNKDLLKFNTFNKHAKEIYDLLNDADLVYYNETGYEFAFLVNELKRAGYIYNIYDRRTFDLYDTEYQRNNLELDNVCKKYLKKDISTYKKFNDKNISYSINITKDIKNIFKCQQIEERYNPITIITEDNFICLEKGELSFNAGKYRKIPIKIINIIDKSYLLWIVSNSEFCKKTKDIVKSLM